MTTDRKRAEVEYPLRINDAGREWIAKKPFDATPRETSRLLIDFGYVVSLLELHKGTSLCELGCGSGWMTRLAARQGVAAEGYDISPAMFEIARKQAEQEAVDVRFEVGDMEEIDLGRRFDACLIYDALHHTPRADLAFRSAWRALRPGGRLLLVEPNWKHRFLARGFAAEHGTTEMGYTPRRLKRLLREAGFRDVQRFHSNRKRLYASAPADVAWHVAEPLLSRVLAPFWTQIWLRATASP